MNKACVPVSNRPATYRGGPQGCQWAFYVLPWNPDALLLLYHPINGGGSEAGPHREKKVSPGFLQNCSPPWSLCDSLRWTMWLPQVTLLGQSGSYLGSHSHSGGNLESLLTLFLFSVKDSSKGGNVMIYSPISLSFFLSIQMRHLVKNGLRIQGQKFSL